jgi:predicted DNA-binding transcriptional regulator AlpA
MADSPITAEAEAMIDERLWNIEEFARFVGIAVGSAYHLVSQGRVPVVKISSRCIRFRPSEIAAWVESKTQKESGD